MSMFGFDRAQAAYDNATPYDDDEEESACRAAVTAVRTLHVEVVEEDGSYCAEDGYTWPCLTIEAVDEAGAP